MKRKHTHPRSPEIECEKCGGEVKVINVVFPNAYECVCEKCKHNFIWLSTEEKCILGLKTKIAEVKKFYDDIVVKFDFL